MIGVAKHYYFKFSLGDLIDFLGQENFGEFTIIEEAGNALPEFIFSFSSEDEDVIRYLHEGNPLSVEYGMNFNEDSATSKLSISTKKMVREGDTRFAIECKGIFDVIPYITDQYVYTSPRKSGVEVICAIADKYFTIDTNTNASRGSMNWIQPNVTDKRFIDEVALHSYYPNSFLGIGISSDGKFIIRDIKQVVKANPAFVFKISDTYKDNEFPFLGDYELESNSGFINCWLGYKRTKPTYDFEDDRILALNQTIDPMLGDTTKLNQTTDVKRRSALHGIQNDNVHENYWNAKLRNLSGLAIFSTEALVLTATTTKYFPIKVLDLVEVQDDSLIDKSRAAYIHTGNYLVGKVVRTLFNKRLITTIHLFREAHSTIKGQTL